MKKSIFAMMAFVLVALLAGCKKESDSEITLSVSEITDSTAVLKCEFAPKKSVRYKLTLGDQTLIFYQGIQTTLRHLAPGTRYNIVAIAQDADKKEVEQKVVEFMTTGEPDNGYIQLIEFDGLLAGEMKPASDQGSSIGITVHSVVDTLPTEVSIITSYSSNENYGYDVVGFDEFYSQSVTINNTQADVKTTRSFSGLVSGNEYAIYYGFERLMGFVKK